ncbi:MAG: T9SS type A sorting domain-containing protein [Bacteroidetes bacterium]|nr:MAG: T9SS type A sorting domain-containing protein [Bacteroidota bacterium]
MYKVFMARRFLILLIVLVFFALRCYPQNISNDARLREVVRDYGQAEVKIPLIDFKSLDILTRNVSILSVSNEVVEISLSPLTVEWFILQKLDYQIIKRTDTKGVTSAINMNQALEWDTYPTYSQYDSIMQSFKNLYPSLCRLDTIGTSVNGKLVLALKISDNAGTKEDEPEVFYTSTMHGNETGGFVLMLRLADYLLKNYNLSPRVKNLVDNLEIWINPLANPDGTYLNGNTISSPVRYNANGTDLNRNFPDPFQPLVIQAKENNDMIKFMRKHKFVISANFHSGSELVNYPWDRWLSKLHTDDSWFRSISRTYADTVHSYSGTGYMTDENDGVTRGAAWYVIYGGRQDFVTYELQGREVTIELDNQYITPTAQLSLLWMYNWHSLVGYLENALYGIHGHVINANSSVPVLAKVFIEGHDRDSSQVYTDGMTGSFVRMLSSGSWNLTFSAVGYNTLTVSNINVSTGQKTDIVIKMIPVINSIDTVKHEAPVLYPNPAVSQIKAVLPDQITGNINIRIINPSGMLISDYNIEAVQGVPVQIDVKRFAAGIYTVVFTNPVTKISSRARFIVVK